MLDTGAFVVLNNEWFPVAASGSVKEEERSPRMVSYGLTGGRRVLAPPASAAREWSIEVSDMPMKYADAREFVRWLSRTQTVFQWVPPEALLYNGLQTLWKDMSRVSPRISSGVPGVGPVGSGGADTGSAVVREGKPYTFSVVTSGVGFAQVYWVLSNGTSIGGPNLGAPVDGRMSVTAIAPEGVASAHIFCSVASEVSSPCISEGRSLKPVTPAAGCAQAVLTYDSMSHKKFSTTEFMDYSFTVSEVM